MDEREWRTSEEWEELHNAKAVSAIQKWEALGGMQLTHEAEYKAAQKELYWALWPLRSSAVVYEGKRYKAHKRSGQLRVTVAPPKKPRRPKS